MPAHQQTPSALRQIDTHKTTWPNCPMLDWFVWTPVTAWMLAKAVLILLAVGVVSFWYTYKTGRALDEDWPNLHWPRGKVTDRRPRTKEQGYSEAELE